MCSSLGFFFSSYCLNMKSYVLRIIRTHVIFYMYLNISGISRIFNLLYFDKGMFGQGAVKLQKTPFCIG